MNALGDGGIWVDSDGTGQNGILLVIGGGGYGNGSHGSPAGTEAYWHIASGGGFSSPQDEVNGVFTPGNTYTVSVVVSGDTHSAYNDPYGSFDGNTVLLTALTNAAYPGGEVGLHDNQPNFTTGSGSGTPTSFSDFSLQGQLVPEPSSMVLIGAGSGWHWHGATAQAHLKGRGGTGPHQTSSATPTTARPRDRRRPGAPRASAHQPSTRSAKARRADELQYIDTTTLRTRTVLLQDGSTVARAAAVAATPLQQA